MQNPLTKPNIIQRGLCVLKGGHDWQTTYTRIMPLGSDLKVKVVQHCSCCNHRREFNWDLVSPTLEHSSQPSA